MLGAPQLKSLRGTMLTYADETEIRKAVSFKIWAKGIYMRTELTAGSRKIISIQRGNTLYTYEEGSKENGTKQWLGTGLASMGFLDQIREVKGYAKKQDPEVIEGELYHRYVYDKNKPQALAIVVLSDKTSLPKVWISYLKLADGTISKLHMYYDDMEANVEIPDAMFSLPRGVRFVR
ncbi:unnamed protein product [marine sediment metagenome]|uniref:Outer membrane lipoprotein-sorting protein n=1 Tax=marine sediment metagenome TaxID=412755 RepID=X1CA21_9ZZZZ